MDKQPIEWIDRIDLQSSSVSELSDGRQLEPSPIGMSRNTSWASVRLARPPVSHSISVKWPFISFSQTIRNYFEFKTQVIKIILNSPSDGNKINYHRLLH